MTRRSVVGWKSNFPGRVLAREFTRMNSDLKKRRLLANYSSSILPNREHLWPQFPPVFPIPVHLRKSRLIKPNLPRY